MASVICKDIIGTKNCFIAKKQSINISWTQTGIFSSLFSPKLKLKYSVVDWSTRQLLPSVNGVPWQINGKHKNGVGRYGSLTDVLLNPSHMLPQLVSP